MKSRRKYYYVWPKMLDEGRVLFLDSRKNHPAKVRVCVLLAPAKRRNGR